MRPRRTGTQGDADVFRWRLDQMINERVATQKRCDSFPKFYSLHAPEV